MDEVKMICIQSHIPSEFSSSIPENNEELGREITRLAGHINSANYRFLKLLAVFVWAVCPEFVGADL